MVALHIDISNFNENQKLAHDIFVNSVGLKPGESSTDGVDGIGSLQILSGLGGCGKTFVLNGIKNTLAAEGILGGNFATTGIAAVGINFFTLHNWTCGFGLTIGYKFIKLSDNKLNIFVAKHNGKQYIVIDEYSMFRQQDLYYLSERCKQIFNNGLPFGGLSVLFVGDIGQLPVVKGECLWSTTSQHQYDQNGHQLYRMFDVVTRLTFNARLDFDDADAVLYDSILKCLHQGKNTEEDVHTIRSKCSRHSMTHEEWQERVFNAQEAVHLYTTNAEVSTHNSNNLMKLGSPIAQVRAVNKGNGKS